jgi:hypothetical protein
MSVTVNRVEISPPERERISREYGLSLPEGHYWYDRTSGAWGCDGTPALGFTRPGLDLGGPLAEDATVRGDGWLGSLVRSRTYVNGRELAQGESLSLAQALLQAGVVLWAGRYWLDAEGQFGKEGGPALVNLRQLLEAIELRDRLRQALAGSGRGGGGGQGYQRQTAGGYIGGDGETSYFFDPETGASVMTGG